MAEFTPTPRNALEAPICNAVESKDFKQALRLIEKRLTKSSDPYLQAMKCYIQCCHPLVVEKGKALAAILDLSKSGRPCTTDELGLYDEALDALFPGRQGNESIIICKLRADAVKAAPKDEKLATECFRACFKRGNLQYAQQIANSLEKNFPANHDYQFWSITTTVLYAKSPSCPENLTTVLTKLAYSKIKFLAENTVKAKDESTLPIRSIQSPQELLLFDRLLLPGDEAALKIYRHERLAPTSKIVKGQWIFRRKQIQFMEHREEWQELFETCHMLLSRSRADVSSNDIVDPRGADWVVWKGIVRATTMFENESILKDVMLEIEAHTSASSGLDKIYRRNAELARLKLGLTVGSERFSRSTIRLVHRSYASHSFAHFGVAEISYPVYALFHFLHIYGHTASAFGDAKKHVEQLNISDQQTFMQFMPCLFRDINVGIFVYGKDDSMQYLPPRREELKTADRITIGITMSKLRYLIKGSMAEASRRASLQQPKNTTMKCDWCLEHCGEVCITCLQSLIIEALHAYGWAMNDDGRLDKSLKPTDRHPADEWAILAAMGLIRMAVYLKTTVGDSETDFPKSSIQNFIRAAAVLEFAHTHSKANPHIQLILIRLYSRLGAGSLAIRAYHRLGLKQIQLNTLGYTLFDRISSLHPHSVADHIGGSVEIFAPLTQLQKMQRFQKAAKNQVLTNALRSFDHGSYDSVLQLMEYSDVFSRSMLLAMSAVESRRIDRLTAHEPVTNTNSHGYDLLPSDPVRGQYWDSFDYSSFVNFEVSNGSTFEMYTRFAPAPSLVRAQAFLLLEELWMLTSTTEKAAADRTNAQLRLRSLEDMKEYIGEMAIRSQQLTSVEKHLVLLGVQLQDLVKHACDSDSEKASQIPMNVREACNGAQYQIAELVKILERVNLASGINGWIPMFSNTLHPLYTAHEAGTLVIAVVDFLLKPEVWTYPNLRGEIELLRAIAVGLRERVSEIAAAARKLINEGPWLGFVLDQIKLEKNVENGSGMDKNKKVEMDGYVWDHVRGMRVKARMPQTIGQSFTEFFGNDFLEHCAGELVDSWRESVMGLACLKSD